MKSILISLAAAVICAASSGYAATFVLTQTLNNPTPESGDYFGGSVAVSGNTVVVGADGDDTGASDAGSAYIFDVTTGDLLQTLNNPTPEAGDNFGYSVAVSGNTAVIGARRDNTGARFAGSAYIFDVTTGDLLQTLNNPTPERDDYFGRSVAVSGNTAVIGARFAGSAYIFDVTTGDLLQTLNNPVAEKSGFGWSVAVSGNTAVVGAFGAPGGGSAYIFDVTTGDLLQTLNNPGAEKSAFGYSVAVSGNTAVVGAWGDDTGAINAGSAYIFDVTTGDLLQTLNNPVAEKSGQFGWSVAVSDNTAVVGAFRPANPAEAPGSAYIFDVTTGDLLQTLNDPTPEADDYFRLGVAVSGNTVVVGADADDTGAPGAGSAYIFVEGQQLTWSFEGENDGALGFGTSLGETSTFSDLNFGEF